MCQGVSTLATSCSPTMTHTWLPTGRKGFTWGSAPMMIPRDKWTFTVSRRCWRSCGAVGLKLEGLILAVHAAAKLQLTIA